jgi:hypothetical protein
MRSREGKVLNLSFALNMRASFLALLLVASAPVASATEAPDARTAYVERRGLIEADAQCRLFTPQIRAALQVGAAQARGSLLRAGWTNARVRELEHAAVSAARSRACNDQRTQAAAADARRAFAGWVNAMRMEFPGWERDWLARRVADASGWRLSQSIEAPSTATFGVRERNGAQQLAFALPVARASAAPASARLFLRDTTRAQLREIALPQRISQGLEAGLPAPNATTSTPSTRTIDRVDGRQFAVFTFPDAAFRTLLALDPRETVEVRVEQGRTSQRYLIEVGDIAAARNFLAIS